MDPELLQSIADEHGLPVQHFDGYSVVDHPTDGPTIIAHPPGVPPMLARPVTGAPLLTPAMQRSRDAMRSAQAEHGHHRAAAVAALPRGVDIAGPPIATDAFGVVTHPDGSREGPPGWLQAEQERARIDALRQTPTSAGTTTFPDGSSVTTDDAGRSASPQAPPIDMELLRAEMAGGPGRGAMREGDVPILADRVRGAAGAVADATGAAWRNTASPEVQAALAPVTDAMGSAVAPSTASAQTQTDGVPPMLARPTGEYAPPSSGASAPIVTARRGASASAGRAAPAPMTLPDAMTQLAGTPQASQAFGQTIGDLAGDYPAARRGPDSIDRQQLLEQQRAGLAERAAHTQAQIEQQAEQQRQQLEQDRAQAVQGARQRYQNAIQRVSDAHLDPARWFRDQGVAGTVSATIAVALGALGQAFTGSSTNSALDQINQAIDRDMTAQQSEIDAARAGADLTGNMLSITRQEFSDRQAANDAARAAMLQQAALHVQEMEGSLAGQEAQNNADAMRAQLTQQAAEAQAAAEERQSQIDLRHAQTLRELGNAQIAQTRADRMQNGGGGAGHPFQASAPMFATFEAALASGFPREQAALLAGFPAGVTPQHSAATTEQRGAIDALSASLGQLESIAGQGDIPGVGLYDSRLPGPEGRLVRDEISNAQDLIGRLRSGGAISDEEAGNFSAILGAGEWQTEDQFRAGLARVRRDLDARLGRTGTQGSAPSREHAAVGFTPG